MRAGYMVLIALAAGGVLSMCAHRYGSVSEEGVREALQASQMALTAHEPGWLLDGKQIHRLSDEQIARVREILTPERVRSVPESYYREESLSNRKDNSDLLFYLYSSSAQCLGGRIVGEKVLMDDFELDDQESAELYKLFRPALIRLFPGKVR